MLAYDWSGLSLCRPPKQWTVLVDTLLPDNGSPCGTFFQASEPRQSSAPVTAYRYALRTLLSKAASETLGTGDLVDRLAIQCANPRRGTDATNRRIRLEVTTTPLTEEQVVDAVDHFLHAYYMSGAFSDAVVALGGGGDFTPTIFMYKLPTSAVYAVCIEGTPGFWCPEEAHRGWDPDNAITA
ncbi:hypothetical protein N2152v2_007166 [Parachlorella kessleri]